VIIARVLAAATGLTRSAGGTEIDLKPASIALSICFAVIGEQLPETTTIGLRGCRTCSSRLSEFLCMNEARADSTTLDPTQKKVLSVLSLSS
jgi:hypothetical protein